MFAGVAFPRSAREAKYCIAPNSVPRTRMIRAFL